MMKVTINVECTPEEARTVMGLPDLAPLHDLYLDKMKQLVTDGLSSADVEKMMGQWLPNMSGNWDQWQKALWGAASGPLKKG
jgi:hypothetical protein